MKYKRHSRILKIIEAQDVNTQEQLTQTLLDEGFQVTQATVSRDIKELGLVKIATAQGDYKYAIPVVQKRGREQDFDLFSNAVTGIDYAVNMIVVKTYPGMASAVAAALDSMIHPEIIGTIAGDDTIFMVAENSELAGRFVDRFKKQLRG